MCFHCKTAIVDPRFVTLDLPELGRRYYHELHFFCGECGDPFLDPSKSSAPGTKRARQKATNDESEDEDETNNFVFHKGHPFCERCHLRLHKPKCRACKQPIPEIALSAMGAQWHKECFVCTVSCLVRGMRLTGRIAVASSRTICSSLEEEMRSVQSATSRWLRYDGIG